MIVIVTIVPLVKKFKEMQRKELRSASATRSVRQADADTSDPVSGFRKTAGKSPKTEKAESPLRNQIGISRADAEQQPHSPGIAEEFDVRKAVLYSEIMALPNSRRSSQRQAHTLIGIDSRIFRKPTRCEIEG